MGKRYVIADQTYAPLFKPWKEERLDTQFGPDAHYIGNILINEDGSFEILFCVVLSSWTRGAVEAAACSDGSSRTKISEEFMFTMYDYVFNHAKKASMYSLVKRSNDKSIKLQKSAELKQTGVIEDFYGEGEDALIFGITKQQWLSGKWSSWNSKRSKNG